MSVLGTLPTSKIKNKINPLVVLRILQVLVLLVFLVGSYGIFVVISAYNELETLTDTLGNTSIYTDAQRLVNSSIGWSNSEQKNEKLNVIKRANKLTDIIAINKSIELEQQQAQLYLDSVQMPYINFLHHFLMPPLNIWKNKFTNKIDDTLVWQKYLQENNYLDVNLIGTWTDFFKDIWEDSPKNEIRSISIGDIAEQRGTFTITMNVDFVAQNKRAFLLLIDKLSTTSNKENLWLLNEFFFHLWMVLKDRDFWWLDSTTTWWVVLQMNTWDAVVWQQLYSWVKDSSSKYVTEKEIIIAMRRFVNCEATEDAERCYFRFREKIRNLPSIAYTLWIPNTNKVYELRKFMQKIPPVINLQSFWFTRLNATTAREQDRWYEWSISLEVYGKSMGDDEVNEIAAYLWSLCLKDWIAMTPAAAMNQVDNTIKQSNQIWGFSNEKSKQFADLKASMQKIEREIWWLPWFKRTVKYFELYRMLQDNKLCVTKN